MSAGEPPYSRCFSGPEPSLIATGVMTDCEVILNVRLEEVAAAVDRL